MSTQKNQPERNNQGTNAERQAKAREQARQIREQQKKKDGQRKFLMRSGIILGAVAVLAVIVLIIVAITKPGTSTQSSEPPRNFVDTGISIGKDQKVATAQQVKDAKANINVFIDFQCPHCREFELAQGEQLSKWEDSDDVVVTYHMLDFMKIYTTTNYSSRAANAAACVADTHPEGFQEFTELLMANQPDSGGEGIKNDGLITYAHQVGATEVDSCITDGHFRGWVEQNTEKSMKTDEIVPGGVQGTPSIFVNGFETSDKYEGSTTDTEALKQFVEKKANVKLS